MELGRLDSNRQRGFGTLELDSGFQSPGLRIPKQICERLAVLPENKENLKS